MEKTINQSDLIISDNLVLDQSQVYSFSKKNAQIVGPIICDNLADFLITSLDYGIDAVEIQELC